jgi:hypothetical protein
MPSRSRASLSAGILVVVTLTLLMLSGCTAPDPHTSSSPTGSGSVPSQRPTPSASSSSQAVVTIAQVSVDGRTLTVGGFVSGVSESGGACVFLISSTSTGVVVRATSDGVSNSGTTSCGSQDVPIAKFTRGAWNVVLDYTSPKLSLTSSALAVQIP